MSIKSFCNSNVVTIEKDQSLEDAANLMREKNVGCLVVTEKHKKRVSPCGMITDRDLALTIGTPNQPDTTKVEQIMQSSPVIAIETDGVAETTFSMNQFGVRRVPVVTEDGSLCGIVSSDDLFKVFAGEILNLASISSMQIKREKGSFMPLGKMEQQQQASDS